MAVTTQAPTRPSLPASAMSVAVLGVLGELALLADEGVRADAPGAIVSAVLTAAVVVWVSYGVLAGRMVRLLLALLLLGLAVVLYGWEAVSGDPGTKWAWLHLGISAAQLAALIALVRSPYHRWQRIHHDTKGVPLAAVLAVAAVAGVLGPLSQGSVAEPGTPGRPEVTFWLG